MPRLFSSNLALLFLAPLPLQGEGVESSAARGVHAFTLVELGVVIATSPYSVAKRNEKIPIFCNSKRR